MTIKLSAAYSRLADPGEVIQLGLRPPAEYRLSRHQVATYRTFIEGGSGRVVFNTALTGDGKSLASMLPTLRAPALPKLMALYPTNELIRDQQGQASRSITSWSRKDVLIKMLDAATLDEIQRDRDLKRAEALTDTLRNSDIVLTNPDIFHYVMQAYYTRGGAHGDAPDRIIAPMLQHFAQFTFDEFHIFQVPQIVSVTNALVFMREMMAARCPHLLFLSATPNELMLDTLQRAHMEPVIVNGEYAHGRSAGDPEHWRLILRQARLDIHAMGVEDWIEAHLQDIVLRFFLDRKPYAKGALIVNSVVTAKRLTAQLRPILAAHGLSVASNTGFDTRSERQRAYGADLLIGTSTVDVGVDFKINFLVFECRDAGSFLQRLGRLGRHDGYERGGATFGFDDFEAHAVVPPWVREQLYESIGGQPPRLTDGMEIDREHFARLIYDAFPPIAEFRNYGRAWGGLQAARICISLRSPTIRDSYADLFSRLQQVYHDTLGVSVQEQMGRLRGMQQRERALHDEALSFRGSSLFECGVIDEQAQGIERIKREDVFTLASSYALGELSQKEFETETGRYGWTVEALKRLELIGYFRCFGVRDERLPVEVFIPFDPGTTGDDWYHRARVIRGVEIVAPGVEGVSHINRALRMTSLPALLSPLDPLELSRRLRLPMPFPIYRARWRGGRGQGSIAFGRQALLLDTALRARPDLLHIAGAEPGALIV